MRKSLEDRYEDWKTDMRHEVIMKDALQNARNRWDNMPEYFQQNKVDLLKFQVLYTLFECGVIYYEDIFTQEAKPIIEDVFEWILEDVI